MTGKGVIRLFVSILVFCQIHLLSAQTLNKDLQKLHMAWQVISTFYVDSVNHQKVTEDAIIAMLKSLDPHSMYISAKEVNAMNEPLAGRFEGIGIEFSLLNDTLLVINPITGGPSEKVGILAGDRIIAVDGKNIAGVGLKANEVYNYLRGPKGTQVQVIVMRKNVARLLTFQIIRDQIPIYSIDASYMASPGIGYIKISRFAATTYDEFLMAIKKLQKAGMQNLILDLRGNGGGFMNAAIDIADELLENKRLIVYTQGVSSPRREHFSTSKGTFDKGGLVVLLDEGSASASEIVAGAVQDWDRGVIMGRRSFGKGLVQRPFSLPDGAVIRLTTAKYYTPVGRSIQKPYGGDADDYEMELYKRFSHGEFMRKDSIRQDESLKYATKVSGRIVYGGGGIMPDVFVPADTSYYSDYYRDLVARGIMNRFVMNYVDGNRQQLISKYSDFKSFNKLYAVERSLIDKLIADGVKEGVDYSEKDYKISYVLLVTQIKALIANNIWGANEYYEIINPLVNTYQEAIELLNSGRMQTLLQR